MRYTVWCNYGHEGWAPSDFSSLQQVKEYIEAGSISTEWRLTKDLEVKIVDPDVEEVRRGR